MELLIVLAGVLLVLLVGWDVFQTIVVPRPTPSRFRIARHVVPPAWRAWRTLITATKTGLARDGLLGMFAPATATILLLAWLVTAVIGYGLILFALRGDLNPSSASLTDVVYVAGTSVLTLGFGDIVASGMAARLVALAAAAGYELAPEAEAWPAFDHARQSYAGRLDALAAYLATPATLWIGQQGAARSAIHERAPQAAR